MQPNLSHTSPLERQRHSHRWHFLTFRQQSFAQFLTFKRSRYKKKISRIISISYSLLFEIGFHTFQLWNGTFSESAPIHFSDLNFVLSVVAVVKRNRINKAIKQTISVTNCQHFPNQLMRARVLCPVSPYLVQWCSTC